MFKRMSTATLAAACVAAIASYAFGQVNPQTAGPKQPAVQRGIDKDSSARKRGGREAVIAEGAITIVNMVQGTVINADMTMAPLPTTYGMTINCRGLAPQRVQILGNGSITRAIAAPNECAVIVDPLPAVACSFLDVQDVDGDGVQTRNYAGTWSTTFMPVGAGAAIPVNGTVTVTVTNNAVCLFPSTSAPKGPGR